MAFKILYVTIKWKPGDVTFVERQKMAVNDTPDHAEAIKKATDLTVQTAKRSAQTHFGRCPEDVLPEMYFEIYNDKCEKSKPLFSTKNLGVMV